MRKLSENSFDISIIIASMILAHMIGAEGFTFHQLTYFSLNFQISERSEKAIKTELFTSRLLLFLKTSALDRCSQS